MTWNPGDLVHLSTERFILRSAEREDITDTFLGWLADPEVMVGLNLPRQCLTRSQAVQYVLSHDNRSKFFLFNICQATNKPIGFYVVAVDAKHACAETSVVVGDRDYWGKNVVIETRSALLDFLFDELNMHKVLGKPHGRNFSSIFNYKAMEFECEAVLSEQMEAADGNSRLDELIFAMFKSQWQSRKEQGAR